METFLRNLAAASALSLSLIAAVSFSVAPALAAATTVQDQSPLPVPSTSNTTLNSENIIQTFPITGGLLYQSCIRGPGSTGGGGQGNITYGCSGLTFVPTNLSGAYTRYLDLTDARFDSGVVPAASGASTTGFNIARTAGTSYTLSGVATSSSGVTTKLLWETNIASTYVPATAIPIIVNANYTTTGTVTAATTTITVNAYTEVGGVETAITGITAAQQFTATAANYTFNIPGTAALVPGQHIAIEIVMLTTTSAGAATGQINGVGVTD